MPSELVSKTRDEFLDAFLKIRNSSPEVTAEQFLARFDEIPNLLENLGIELDDRTAEEIIGDRDVDRNVRSFTRLRRKLVAGVRANRCAYTMCATNY